MESNASTQIDQAVVRNHLAPLLVQALRDIVELKRAGHVYREANRIAIELIADRDRQIKTRDARIAQLRAELRAAMSGRTIAAERADIEREDMDRDVERAA